jgi:methyl coenzyme M reductase alpha subunit
LAVENRRLELVDTTDLDGAGGVTFGEWWTCVQSMVQAVSQASIRVGLGIMAAGFAISASNTLGSHENAGYGKVMFGASAFFAAWFTLSAIRSKIRGR